MLVFIENAHFWPISDQYGAVYSHFLVLENLPLWLDRTVYGLKELLLQRFAGLELAAIQQRNRLAEVAQPGRATSLELNDAQAHLQLVTEFDQARLRRPACRKLTPALQGHTRKGASQVLGSGILGARLGARGQELRAQLWNIAEQSLAQIVNGRQAEGAVDVDLGLATRLPIRRNLRPQRQNHKRNPVGMGSNRLGIAQSSLNPTGAWEVPKRGGAKEWF